VKKILIKKIQEEQDRLIELKADLKHQSDENIEILNQKTADIDKINIKLEESVTKYE
jgi:hypothetical protein